MVLLSDCLLTTAEHQRVLSSAIGLQRTNIESADTEALRDKAVI